jgi:transposase
VTGATAEPLLLRQIDRDELVGLTRSSSVGAGLAARARIVLLAAEGTPNVEIARLVGVSRPTVNAWRTRYAERGLPGLADEQRSGRKRSIDQRRIVAETLRPPPAGLGVTHWSSRLLADRLGTSHVTVAAAWKRYGVKPWKAETFKFSTDPELEAKVTDIIGLYLAPPENAIVLCCDEKSQIQESVKSFV